MQQCSTWGTQTGNHQFRSFDSEIILLAKQPTSLHRKVALEYCRDAIVHIPKNWASGCTCPAKLGYSRIPQGWPCSIESTVWTYVACASNNMDPFPLAQHRQQSQGRLDACNVDDDVMLAQWGADFDDCIRVRHLISPDGWGKCHRLAH